MNTIPCPLVVKINNGTERLPSHEIAANQNTIIYDLKPNDPFNLNPFEIEIKQSSQVEGCQNLQKTRLMAYTGRVNQVSKEVTINKDSYFS